MTFTTRHSAQDRRQPYGAAVCMAAAQLLILGQAPLMGAITGYLALEFGPQGGTSGARLWTLYDHEKGVFPWGQRETPTKLPYARLCSDAPRGAPELAPLTFWVNPKDPLTQSAGFGAEWLDEVPCTPRNGLLMARLNPLMLDSAAITALTGRQPIQQ